MAEEQSGDSPRPGRTEADLVTSLALCEETGSSIPSLQDRKPRCNKVN